MEVMVSVSLPLVCMLLLQGLTLDMLRVFCQKRLLYNAGLRGSN